MRLLPHFVLAFALILSSIVAPDASCAQPATSPEKRLKVATRIVPPLVVEQADGELTGFSIDLWRAIAKSGNLPFDFVVKASLPELIAAVRNGEVDAAVAAVSITSQREVMFDFSQPVLDSGLQVLVREPSRDGGGLNNLLAMLTSPTLYELLGVLLLLSLIPAPFIWIAERRHDEGIVAPGPKPRGLLKAAWWSMSVLGGQAEEMPRSVPGRIVAVLCIFASVLFISYFTATTTTILTVRQLTGAIRGPADLPGRTVGTVTASTAASYLAAEGIQSVAVARIEDAVADLDKGRVDAVVYDAPILLYYASHAGHGKAQVVGPVFRREDYGVLFPTGSALRKPVNAALLALREDGGYRAIHSNWFGQ